MLVRSGRPTVDLLNLVKKGHKLETMTILRPKWRVIDGWISCGVILHVFYNALNPLSKNIFDTTAGGAFMGWRASEAKKLLADMWENHAQWHAERTSTRKVNSITKEKNEEPTTKIDELIVIIKGKEDISINAINESATNDANFVARGNYSSGGENQILMVLIIRSPTLALQVLQIIISTTMAKATVIAKP